MCFLSVLRGEVSAEDEHSCKMFTQGKQVRSGIPRLRSNTCTAVPIRSSKYETGLIPTRFPTRCRPRHIAQTQVSPGVTQKIRMLQPHSTANILLTERGLELTGRASRDKNAQGAEGELRLHTPRRLRPPTWRIQLQKISDQHAPLTYGDAESAEIVSMRPLRPRI